MNGYIALFKERREEIFAETLWEAKTTALRMFKPSKRDEWRVIVQLAEVDGAPVVHKADF